MGKIKVLSTELSNKIAAGEVVERPASVVKELLENAIDAKSRRIFVSVEEGGIRLIKVVDDGEGISRDEAALAFKRHATSKISGEQDLNAIFTLGFRGEALPSIASISKIALVSQCDGESEGTEILIEGGSVKSSKTVGCSRGATFEVRDLFYNVPARRKFLKSRQTEMGHISRIFFQLALAHFKIHFKLTHGSRLLIDTPACSTAKERAFQLLGAKVTADTMMVSEDSFVVKGLGIKALISRPPLKRNFKKEQYIYVNERPIKSALLTRAVYDAYQSFLMKGEEPFFLLFLKIDPAEVDVNVHPTKMEVRFRNTNQVYQAVRQMIRSALSSAGISPLTKSSPEEWGDPRKKYTNPSFDAPHTIEGKALAAGWPDGVGPKDPVFQVREKSRAYNVADETRYKAEFFQNPLFQTGENEAEWPALETPGTVSLIRPLAQVYGTFLLAEIDGELAIVDQHTAHERILYEQFLNAWEQRNTNEEAGVEMQVLLIPQQIDLSLPQSAILQGQIGLLESMGFKIEPFGETTFLVRELPALIAKMDVVSFLNELTEDLIELGVSSKAEQPIRTIMASMACHGAVRAHQSLSFPEIKTLLEQYFERKTPPTCPHGRPIVMRYSLLDLEKMFRRK